MLLIHRIESVAMSIVDDGEYRNPSGIAWREPQADQLVIVPYNQKTGEDP